MATYGFTVRAKDETGAFADRSFSIEVRNTMVDRALAVDGTDAYSSVDGNSWSRKPGMGGVWCDNLLGKWLVAVNATTYRVSEDTINWQEGLSFRLANDAPVYDDPTEDTPEEDIDENGQVLVKPAGPLNNVAFTFNSKRMVEIGGRVYVLATVAGKIGVVTSTDLVNWYLIVASEEGDTTNNYFGIGRNVSTDMRVWSCVEKHNDQFVLLDGAAKVFITSDDMKSFSPTLPSNPAVLRWITPSHPRNQVYNINIKSINGVLFINYTSISGTSTWPSRGFPNSLVFYTIDLLNISIPNNNIYSSHYAGFTLPFNSIYYNNGLLYTLTNTGLSFLDRPTMSNNVQSISNAVDATVFDGDVLVVAGGVLRFINSEGSMQTKPTTGLPTANLRSVCSM